MPASTVRRVCPCWSPRVRRPRTARRVRKRPRRQPLFGTEGSPQTRRTRNFRVGFTFLFCPVVNICGESLRSGTRLILQTEAHGVGGGDGDRRSFLRKPIERAEDQAQVGNRRTRSWAPAALIAVEVARQV